MSRRGPTILVSALLAGLVATVLIGAMLSKPVTQAVRPPELGGQKVPDTVFDIRYDKRYDLFCSFYADEPTIYRNCTIVGFTGRGEEPTGSASVPSFGILSTASDSYGRYFDHWLVVKLADGRLAYIPPSAVKYLEEASTKSQ